MSGYNIAMISSVGTTYEEIGQNQPDEFEQIASGFRTQASDWHFSHYRAYLNEFPGSLDNIDGVVFTGSPASVNGDEVWIKNLLAFIETLHAQKMPMVGICFGHQAIAKALGGRVEKNAHGWSLGAVPVEWKNFAPWMNPRQSAMTLFAIHNEQVAEPPQGAVVTASSENCPIAGFRLGEHILTTQHHIEMPAEFVGVVLEYLAKGENDVSVQQLIEQAQVSLSKVVHSAVVLEWAAALFKRNTGV